MVLTSVVIFSYSPEGTISANNVFTQIQKALNRDSVETLQEPKIAARVTEQARNNQNNNMGNVTPSPQPTQAAGNNPNPTEEPPQSQTISPSLVPNSSPKPNPTQTNPSQYQNTPIPTNPPVNPTKNPNVIENYPVTPPSDIRNMPIKKRTFRKLDGKTACEIFTTEMANKVLNQPSRILGEGEYTIGELTDDLVGRAESDVCVYQTTDGKYIYFGIFKAKSEEDYIHILEAYRKSLEERGIDTTDFYKNYGGGETMGDILAMKEYINMNNFSDAIVVLNYGQYAMYVNTNLNSREKIIMLTEMMKELGIN